MIEFLTTILFWCNFERHSILFLLCFHSYINSSNYGIWWPRLCQTTAHSPFSIPDEQSRISLRQEREYFLSDVLSSAVGGWCDPCGSRLIGPWLSWGCVLAEVLVDGVIFFLLQAGAQHLPRALKRTAHPSLDIQNLIICIYVLIEPAIFSS